jgi:hypothetical protein
MKTNVVSGATIAATAIALALSGAAVSPALAKKAPVHCTGINACKGKGACKTASNECKGQNACKGQGWVPAKSAKACEAKGGQVAAE